MYSTGFDIKLRPDTTAVWKPSGIHPSMSEHLTNLVTDGSSILLHFLMRNIDHVSNRQDFVGEFIDILSTASSET